MRRLLMILLLIGIFLLSGCSKNIDCGQMLQPVCGVDGKTYNNKCMAGDVEIAHGGVCDNSNNTQLANPASKFCVDNGGTLNIKTADDGSQTGYCTIAGFECEEWALFRGECAQIQICTDAQKAAEICTMEYMPVCGSDGITYGNKCGACSAKADYWIQGECA